MVFTESITEQISLAQRIAVAAHADQVDKVGRPYLEHVTRVAEGVDGLDRAVAWLHDVVEDTPTTADDLLAAGVQPDVVAAVEAISRGEDEEPDHYYARVRANAMALRVKTSDIADNSSAARQSDLDEATRTRLAAKYAHARSELGLPAA